MEITIIAFTSDVTLNYFMSIFVYMTSLLAPIFGGFSLMAK